MVDLAVPSMERRPALMPPITPVSRHKRRSTAQKPRVSSSSFDSLTVPGGPVLNTTIKEISTVENNTEPLLETNCNHSKTSTNCGPPSPTNLRGGGGRRASVATKRNTFKNFLDKFGSYGNNCDNVRNNNIQLESGTMLSLSKSDDGTLDRHYHGNEVQRSPEAQRNKKRSLHIDITQYKPRRLSKDELKMRRKISQSDCSPWMTQHLIPNFGDTPRTNYSSCRDFDELFDNGVGVVETSIPLVVTEEDDDTGTTMTTECLQNGTTTSLLHGDSNRPKSHPVAIT